MTVSFEVPRASYRRRLALLFRLLARGPRRIVLAVLAVVGVVTVAGAVQSVGLRAVIDRASAGDLEAVTIAALVTGLAIGFAGIAGRINTDLQLVLGLQVGLEVDRATVDLTATMPGVEHLERPGYLDQVAVLRTSGRDLTSSVFSVIGMVSLALQIAIGVALLAAVDPVLVFVPLFAVPSVLLAPRARRIVERAQTSAAEDERVATQLHDLFLRPAAAMELRVFDAEQTLDRRASTAWERATDARLRGTLRSAALSAVGYLLLGIGYIGALALVTVRASNGDATPGDVILVAQLTLMLRNNVSQVASSAGAATSAMYTADRYLWLDAFAREQAERYSGTAAAPEHLATGITFDHVSFRYPGTTDDVLHDVSLTIPAGTTVAIVGENGAGKTTLVKLLCGFYPVDSGRILVDGFDLRTIDHGAWRTRLTGSFQDHLRLETIARHSIGAGLPAKRDDDHHVRDAMARAGTSKLVEELNAGLDTPLGKTHTDGAELSGGQWQRIAITRGSMQAESLCLILDEPTAALDPSAEHELFERYSEQAADAAERFGGVTILVSHRFSTVRMADLIVAIEDGQVVETGTHDQLMAHDGLYHRMYEEQARAYR